DHVERWWLLWRSRSDLIEALKTIPRYLACSRVTKRPIFVFVDSAIRPGDALQCFAMSDDYSFGILQSSPHWQWFVAKCSKLTERLHYSPESVFDTFPWPQSPDAKAVAAVAAAGREVRRIRAEALPKMKGGLRALYRTLELPGANPLKDAHAALDAAVLVAYGFSAKADLLAQLLALNQQVAARTRDRPRHPARLPPTGNAPHRRLHPPRHRVISRAPAGAHDGCGGVWGLASPANVRHAPACEASITTHSRNRTRPVSIS
ncbi:MAG TPA: type IIL restriction-modification enzyme MmeI, partial [Terrimicrobium sp.]